MEMEDELETPPTTPQIDVQGDYMNHPTFLSNLNKCYYSWTLGQ